MNQELEEKVFSALRKHVERETAYAQMDELTPILKAEAARIEAAVPIGVITGDYWC